MASARSKFDSLNGEGQMSNGLRVQTWYSVASVTGLSLVSLGSPGLKSEMDEQIFTGGTTAVAQLLGEEVWRNE
jgi:hypothetical protein